MSGEIENYGRAKCRAEQQSAERIENYERVLGAVRGMIRKYIAGSGQKTNTELLNFYWGIGNVLWAEREGEGWRTKGIKLLAADLRKEFEGETMFNERNLRYMRSFAAPAPKPPKGGFSYSEVAPTPKSPKGDLCFTAKGGFKDVVFTDEVMAKVSWYHHTVLLDKVGDFEERLFYMQRAVDNGWSARVMAGQIGKGIYRRQGAAISNFAETMPEYEAGLAMGMFRSPYIFDFMAGVGLSEREVENGLIANLKDFMHALGRGFAYVGNQYTLPIADTHYYLDLLFYNTHLHCYVVVELKVDDFVPEYIGKLNFYVTKVDEAIRGRGDNPTIGLLLCKVPNEAIARYAVKNLRSPIGVAGYIYL